MTILQQRLKYDYNLYKFIKQLFYKNVKWLGSNISS